MEEEHKKMPKPDSNFKQILLMVIPWILTIIMAYTGIQLFFWWSDNKENKDLLSEISNTVTVRDTTEEEKQQGIGQDKKYDVDFTSLKLTNPDTVAWLKIEGIDIEFPVVKTTNNSFYLNHGFDRSSNSAGWIFMDYENKLDGTDKNIVIYGHNRKDGSMFAPLKGILEPKWYSNDKNRYVTFITEKENAVYEIFSVYEILNEDYYISVNFPTDNDLRRFIYRLQVRSLRDYGVEVTENDTILTVSTCADNNNYRVVLHAKKTK